MAMPPTMGDDDFGGSYLVCSSLSRFNFKIWQRKSAEKESRGTLDHFLKVLTPESDVLMTFDDLQHMAVCRDRAGAKSWDPKGSAGT